MSPYSTLLAAAVVFALAACQPDPAGNNARAANATDDDPMLLVQADQEQADQEPVDQEDEDDLDPEEDNGNKGDEEDSDDDSVAASPARATEQADEAAHDALLDTRRGGNPMADPAIAPVDPIAQEDDDEDDDED